ncbi:hypothetical protein GGTG_05040 [Gaeumannomyces tritici R3-111a-1]|uniref:Uncharacterized protein n=1 Tax=Gaeumannomyces tritici (strain R3-111a-1) TaxID=644352 RepID=J3NUT4_GAET3|nr:hypothetical protein GGTG_05040 [Gaeumannomyces tritici R3-111a-1]EJT79958.1 hypothetical protein GGTG_05040 [Gaeumannomyces tritici R3-111a-1]
MPSAMPEQGGPQTPDRHAVGDSLMSFNDSNGNDMSAHMNEASACPWCSLACQACHYIDEVLALSSSDLCPSSAYNQLRRLEAFTACASRRSPLLPPAGRQLFARSLLPSHSLPRAGEQARGTHGIISVPPQPVQQQGYDSYQTISDEELESDDDNPGLTGDNPESADESADNDLEPADNDL